MKRFAVMKVMLIRLNGRRTIFEEVFIMPGHGFPRNMGRLKYKERRFWDAALGQTSH